MSARNGIIRKGPAPDPSEHISLAEINAELDAIAVEQGIVWDSWMTGSHDTSVRTRYATPGTSVGTGVVRIVSPRQVAFMKRLMAERDLSTLVRLPGSEDIEHMSLRGARDLIERLLACPELPIERRTARPATESMRNYVRSMLATRVCDREADPDTITFDEAHAFLDANKGAPLQPAESVAGASVTPGLYMRTDGTVVRVQKTRNGARLYGKVWQPKTRSFAYASGALTGLTQEHRMNLEQAEKLSEATGMCIMCRRDLTATVDGVAPINRYIGPICARRI